MRPSRNTLPFFPCAVWTVRIMCQPSTERLYRRAGCSRSSALCAGTEPGQEHTPGDAPRHRAHPLFIVLCFERAAPGMPNRGVYIPHLKGEKKKRILGDESREVESSASSSFSSFTVKLSGGLFRGSSWRLTSLDSTVNSRAGFARLPAPASYTSPRPSGAPPACTFNFDGACSCQWRQRRSAPFMSFQLK